MKSIAALVFALLVAAACHESSSDDPEFLVPGTNNLGVAANEFRFDGDTLVVQVMEHPGFDLNADGDFVDAALQIVDLRSGQKTLLPYAANRGFVVDDGFIAFTVVECAQGADLDGDGGIDCDQVLFVHDVQANQTTNLGLPLRTFTIFPYLAQEGSVLAFAVSEGALQRDLDGDGSVTRDLVFTYEADLGRLTPLFVATDLRPIVEDGRVFVAALEEGYGDKNGDGDTFDRVLLAYDVRTGATENLGRAVQGQSGNFPWIGVEGPLLAINVPESLQGVDQNGDGDMGDSLVEIRDLASGSILPTNLPASAMTVAGGLVGIYAPEITFTDFVGTDYDGDGEMTSTVAFFYDWFTGTLTNTHIAVDSWSGFAFTRPPRMSNRRAAFVAFEKVDLNGDGDTADHSLLTFDARSGTTQDTFLFVWPESQVLDIDPEHVVCAAFPSSGVGDLESVVVGFPPVEPHRIGLSVRRQELAGGHVLVSVLESVEGLDLTGDGDLEDLVLEIYELRTGQTFNTGIAVSTNDTIATAVEFENGRLAVQASEFFQGRDLNGDGDQDDFVLQVVRVP